MVWILPVKDSGNVVGWQVAQRRKDGIIVTYTKDGARSLVSLVRLLMLEADAIRVARKFRLRTAEKYSGWNKKPPRCKLHNSMRFMDSETEVDKDYGFIPLCFTCEDFEKNEEEQ